MHLEGRFGVLPIDVFRPSEATLLDEFPVAFLVFVLLPVDLFGVGHILGDVV